MAVEAIRCPYGQSEAVMKYGKASNGKARVRCQSGAQCGRTFLRESAYPGRTPEVKEQMIELTLKGSGVHDIARGLRVSPSTVIGELQKRPARSPRLIPSSWKGAVRMR